MDLNNNKNTILLVGACIILGMILMSLLMILFNDSDKRITFTEKAPKPSGPYSQAVVTGGFVYTSGQIGIDPGTGVLADTIENQTKQVMENLREVLIASGCEFQDVIQTRIYITNISDFSTVNEIYAGFMGNSLPARSTVQVAGLPKGALVEIEMIGKKT